MEHKEKNINNLKKAINQLPEYEAPDSIWEAINDQMESDQKEKALKEAILKLPSFDPPETVWADIRADLPSPKTKVRSLYLQRIAASIALLILAGFGWTYFSQPGESVEIAYSEIIEEEVNFTADWDADEEDIEVVLALYQENNQQDLSEENLESELEELNLAKEEVKEAMDVFGSDADLINQLSEIERQRAEVIKRMASYI